MSKLRDLTGQRSGKLIAIRRDGSDKHKRALWLCLCECGNTHIVPSIHFVNKKIQSCGCLRKENYLSIVGTKQGKLKILEMFIDDNTKRTMFKCLCDCGNYANVQCSNITSDRPTLSCGCLINSHNANKKYHTDDIHYSRAVGIWQRCNNKNHSSYNDYGGKGIKCPNEIQDIVDMLHSVNGYEQGLSIDRIDRNGDYILDNLRWATDVEQAENRNIVRKLFLYLDDILIQQCESVIECSKITGHSTATIRKYIKNGKKTKKNYSFIEKTIGN